MAVEVKRWREARAFEEGRVLARADAVPIGDVRFLGQQAGHSGLLRFYSKAGRQVVWQKCFVTHATQAVHPFLDIDISHRGVGESKS